MPTTREPNYPVEYAQLADAFMRCADGYEADVVLNAAVQMVAASIGFICKARGCSLDDARGYAAHIGQIITKEVIGNWDRARQPTDIAVRTS